MIYHSMPTIGVEEKLALLEVLDSGQVTCGKRVHEFEKQLSKYIGVKYAIAVSSGLSGLHLALLSLDIGDGDEVIIPSYVCEALLNAVLYVHAKPIITDVEVETGNISPENLKKKISNKTKAIIVPHMFGLPANLGKLISLGIPIIEDCAHSVGAMYEGKRIGTFGIASVFSFYATKMICTGEGGMVLTDDEQIAGKIRDLRDYTGKIEFKVRYNYKMTEIEAAMGIAQLSKLDLFIQQRTELAKIYTDMLDGHCLIVLPFVKNNSKHVFYRYIVRVKSGNLHKIKREMKKEGIMIGNGVLHPLHRLLGIDPIMFPNAERLSKEVISLPIYPSLKREEILYITTKLISILKE